MICPTLFGASACSDYAGSGDKVNLISVNGTQVGVNDGIDYYVVPEPAATVRVNAVAGLETVGSLQQLYGGENGYPQAVAVIKNELLNYDIFGEFSEKLSASKSWLLSEDTAIDAVISAVQANLSAGMTPTFNANNLTKTVIENCFIDFKTADSQKEEIISFMQKLDAVSDAPFGLPSDKFFGASGGTEKYDGEISVYAPDGAPALGLANIMSEAGFYNGKVKFNIVDATTIQTFVTGATPKADICVLPVNLAVKLLGGGEKYSLLGTLTHGNLYLLSKDKERITTDNLSKLKGKRVGVVNLAAVPGLTFKLILKNNSLEYTEIK